VAVAAQINHGGLGPINPALYKIGADSTHCANGFFDVTTGNNTADPSVIGSRPPRAGTRSPGWGRRTRRSCCRLQI